MTWTGMRTRWATPRAVERTPTGSLSFSMSSLSIIARPQCQKPPEMSTAEHLLEVLPQPLGDIGAALLLPCYPLEVLQHLHEVVAQHEPGVGDDLPGPII